MVGTSPVIVGVGQLANKDPERIVHPAELMRDAAAEALADAGADLLAHIGAVHSAPMSIFADEQGGEMVAAMLGIPSGRRVQWSYSGAAPQSHLLAACAEIERGEVDAVLLVGGIADASFRNATRRGLEPPAPPTSIWSQGSDGVGRQRPLGKYEMDMAEADAGAELPSSFFALVESAIGARLGLDAAAHRQRLGEILEQFAATAARRPEIAWLTDAPSATDIATPSPANRFIAEPYTKRMCSFPTIDLAAAVVVTSESLADRLGVPADRRVRPWSGASAKEPGPPSVRAELDAAPALDRAVARALEIADIDPSRIGAFDLYSCFPAAIQLGMRAFGIDVGDARPLTQTGGLPFFGGPGANYTLHGIVGIVEHCRAVPGDVGAVVGLGGMVNDFSVGLYSTAEPDRPFGAESIARPEEVAVATAPSGSGAGVIEGATVLHERDRGAVAAPAIVRLPDGRRVGARLADPSAAGELSERSLVGCAVRLTERDGRTLYELS